LLGVSTTFSAAAGAKARSFSSFETCTGKCRKVPARGK
jgi:hypothetical protein